MRHGLEVYHFLNKTFGNVAGNMDNVRSIRKTMIFSPFSNVLNDMTNELGLGNVGILNVEHLRNFKGGDYFIGIMVFQPVVIHHIKADIDCAGVQLNLHEVDVAAPVVASGAARTAFTIAFNFPNAAVFQSHNIIAHDNPFLVCEVFRPLYYLYYTACLC